MVNSPTSKTGSGGVSADAGLMRAPAHSITQKLRMGTASVDEINAAYNKVLPELVNLAHYYAGMVNIPFVNVSAMIDKQINTPEFKRQAVQIIADAITAAEAVHETPPEPTVAAKT